MPWAGARLSTGVSTGMSSEGSAASPTSPPALSHASAQGMQVCGAMEEHRASGEGCSRAPPQPEHPCHEAPISRFQS